MDIHTYTIAQQKVLNTPINSHIFLEGPFKTGKTSTATARLKQIAAQMDISHQVLILVPQLSLANRYRRTVIDMNFPAGIPPTITTLAGLSQQFIKLYWSEIVANFSFNNPDSQPTFLSMETAQFFMEQICQPFIEKGYFHALRIDRARLYSQILDTMNKAALVGYALDETAPRLSSAWNNKDANNKNHEQSYVQSQECALAFRQFCFENNVLDYSLQVEIFRTLVLKNKTLRKRFFENYAFLIADNLEEDVPTLHDLILKLDADIPSMLLIMDSQAGYRTFLGADPISAGRLKNICQYTYSLDEQFNLSEAVRDFKLSMNHCILRKDTQHLAPNARSAFTLRALQFYPEMIAETGSVIAELVHQKHVNPSEIAILSPYLPDSLKFSLSQGLSAADIPFLTSRPSRTLADEPITQAVLVFARAAHPQWGLTIQVEELRHAIMTLFPTCDILRANLLAKNTLKENRTLDFYHAVPSFTQERITDDIGKLYDQLISWIQDTYFHQEPLPLDIFLSRLFGEILSQPGFGLHDDIDNAAILTKLIRSIRDFRLMFSSLAKEQGRDINKTYLQTLQSGILPARTNQDTQKSDAVLISPAFTFLMKNECVKYQFWLDIGSMGWWERLDQPLTHPYVLSRNWSLEQHWSDAEEYQANQSALARLIQGLLDRCEEHVYLYAVGLNQAGINQSSPLLSAMQLFLKRMIGAESHE